MAKYLPLPDGTSLKVPDEMGYDEAVALAKQRFPEAFAQSKPAPKTGIMADIAGSASNLLNLGRTGLASLTGDSNLAVAEGLKRQQATQDKYKSGLDLEKITQPFEQGDYLASAGEAVRQVPSAVASLAPSVAQEMTLAKLGRVGGGALGALLGRSKGAADVGAEIGQYGTTYLVNAIQALGGQAQAKAQEQLQAGQKVDIDTAELLPYAGANAALNLVGTKIAMPAVFKKAIGQRVAAEADDAARAVLLAEAQKVAKRGTLETIGRGIGGFAIGELPTEILQDVVDRAAIGKPLDDDEAIKDYRNTALTMLLAAPIGGGFGVQQRSGARDVVAQDETAQAQQRRTVGLQQEQMAAQQQQAHEEAAAQALEIERQSPEYAKSVVTQYDTLQKQKQDLIAQKRKIVDASPTADADRAFNAELNQQLKTIAAEIKPLAGEYNRVQPIIQQEAEKQRVAGMTPEDYMLEQMGQQDTGIQAAGRKTNKGQLFPTEELAPAPADTTLQDYAAGQITAAQGVGALTTNDYLDYLMQDPETARQLLLNRVQLPLLVKPQEDKKAQERNQKQAEKTIYSALGLQLKAYDKQQAEQNRLQAEQQAEQDRIKAEQADRVRGQMTGAAPGSEIMGAAKDRGPGAVPEIVALRNIGDKNRAPATGGIAKSYMTDASPQGKLISERIKPAQEALPEDYDDTFSAKDTELVQSIVDTLPKGGMITPGQVFQGLGGGTMRERSDLLTQLAVAREASGKSRQGGVKDNDVSRGIIEKLRALKETETTGKGQETAPMQTVLAGISVPEARAKEAAANKYADQQNQQLLTLTRMLGKVNQGTLVLPDTFKQRTDAAKQAYFEHHANEIDARRDAFGLAPMAAWERGEARARVMEALNELGDRWGGAANAGPAGQRQFGSQVQAVSALQEQMRANIQSTVANAAKRANLNATNEVAEKTGATPTQYYTEDAQGNKKPIEVKQEQPQRRIAAPAELTLREEKQPASIEDSIQTLLDTSDTRERAVPTAAIKPVKKVGSLADISQLLTQERSDGTLEPMSAGSISLLQKLQEVLPQTTDEDFRTLAGKIVRQIRTGNEPNLFDVRDLTEMSKGMEAAGQSETRPGTSTEELQRTSAQPQLDLFPEAEVQTQRATPRNFQKLLDSKNIQELREAIAQQRADNQAALEQAQGNIPKLQTALEKAQANYDAALKNTQETTPDKIALEKANKQESEGIVEVLEGLRFTKRNLETRLAEIQALRDGIYAAGESNAMFGNRATIEAANAFKDEPALRKRLETINESLANAGVLQKAIQQMQAGEKPFIEKGEAAAAQAESAFDESKKILRDAQKTANEERRAAEQKTEPRVEIGTSDAEYKATLQRAREGLNLPGIRNLVDTTSMKQTIAEIRSAMGSLDGQLENKNLTEEQRAKLQTSRDNKARKLEYVYQDAPRITSDIKEDGQLALERAFDDAQAKAYDKQMSKRRKRAGESAPVLPSVKSGPVVKGVRSSVISQSGEKTATAATEEAGTALETLAEERAKLADLERREKFLRDNGKAKSGGRLTPTFKALQASIDKQKGVVAKAAEEQGKIVAEVRETQQALGKKKIQNVASETEVGLKGDEASIPKPPKVAFSRGPTASPSTVNTVNTELKKYFKDLTRIKIYSSVDALITANPQYKKLIPADARGFVDTAGNKAFLIAENIDQGQALGVLLHEIGAHVGLKNILGESQYTGMVNAIKGWAKKNDGSVESVVAKAAIARVEAAKTDAKHRDDEILAYAIEEAVKAGVIPNQTKGVLGTWLSRIADGFRKLLTKFGMDLKSFDAQGLVDIAYGAAQMEMRAVPEGMSRRTFLRGAVSAVGQMYLPAVNTGLSINAKAKLFDATLDAADAWFSTVVGMAKTPALRNMLKNYSFDIDNEAFAEALYNVDSDVEGVDSVYSHMFMRSYGNGGDPTESLIDLLESKPDAVEKLQMAVLDMRSQLVAAIDKLPKKQNGEIAEDKLPAVGDLLFSRNSQYGQNDALSDLARRVVAQPKSFSQRMGSHFALETEMNLVDMRAGLREALKAGAKEMGDTKNFVQAMYSVTKSDQKMAVVSATLMNGPMELYTDAKGFHGIRSTNEHSAKEVFDAIGRIPGGNARGRVDLATTYMIAQRAANKGLAKLDVGGLGISEADLRSAMASVNADPKLRNALEAVRTSYNAYNKGLIQFLASTGAIPKETATKLLKDGDYVPFYRVNENGMADLVFSDEVTINIGDIRHQPYLAELKGGESKILPLTESLPRNTLLITDKALTNLATKNVAYAFQSIGAGKGRPDKEGKPTNAMPIHKGSAPAGSDIIKFNQEPDANDPKDDGQRWVRVRTDDTIMGGIPAELIVKSLEGAHLTLPAFLKIGGIAGDILRAGVTRMPIYIARQLVRDPMAASFTGGLNYNPLTAVAKAGQEFVRMTRGTSETGKKLIEKGLIQSGIFTGDPDDIAKMALQLAGNNQGAIDRLFAGMDKAAMNADAATRALVYDNAIKNGLSEVEADMATMESMNFYKRGLSPTVQYASRLIPFFNAQIQGLNVLYKAATGQMPFEEQQRIKQKFFNNAMLLVGTGILYAMAMEDDEYFKNAKPKDKYSNFFIPIPGVDEPFKLPIPYEAGWFFSLAVAAVDAMKAETDGKQQFDALRDMFLQSIPGYSSRGMPQLVKPAFEVFTNRNFFNGNEIETARMQSKTLQERFSTSTTEAAKAMSKALPLLSPVQIEHLSNGYFGQLPLIVMGAANSLFRSPTAGEAPDKRITEMPFIGSSFQKKFGGADADVMYRMATESLQAKASYESMIKQGRKEDAKDFLADNRTEVAVAGLANQYKTVMGRLRTDEERIRGMENMSAAEKRVRIDRLDAARQDISAKFENAIKRAEASGKT